MTLVLYNAEIRNYEDLLKNKIVTVNIHKSHVITEYNYLSIFVGITDMSVINYIDFKGNPQQVDMRENGVTVDIEDQKLILQLLTRKICKEDE